MTQEGEAPWDDGAMTRCTHCYRDTAIWSADGKCPSCIAEATGFGKDEQEEAPLRRKGICKGCDKAKWLYDGSDQCDECRVHGPPQADPHEVCNETIRARDRSIAEYSTRVRMLEKRAEDAERENDGFQEAINEAIQENAAIKEDRDQFARLAGQWMDRAERLQRERERWVRRAGYVRKSRDEWKANAEELRGLLTVFKSGELLWGEIEAHKGCHARIDRGLAYVCGDMHEGGEFGCGGYYCYEHLVTTIPEQLCAECDAALEGEE